jgi:xanthine dehydrogenase small subunit
MSAADPSVSVDGRAIPLAAVDPHQPLLHFLRERGLTGVKEGCAEGECGACAVVVVAPADGSAGGEESRFVTVNSCLVPAVALAGREVVTVHGLAEGEELHPAQAAMVETGGSQCGYCTPGFVMSLFTEYYRQGRQPGEVWAEAIGGNLCRCTGYRPIRDALAKLESPADDRHKRRLAQVTEPTASYHHDAPDGAFHRPASLAELFEVLGEHPEAKLVAGGTDVYVEINQLDRRWPVLVSLEAVTELRGIAEDDDAITIGAGVPLSEVEYTLGERVSILGELFPLFSSRLIRNRATLGGNLINASPIGDSPPALLALDASVVLAGAEGERELPLSELFLDYRKTALEPGEILKAVRLPKPLPTIQRFFKASKRVMDDISTVAAGFGLWVEGGKVTKARLAYGGVAATPVRAEAAEDALVGHSFDAMAVVRAATHLRTAFTPMSDHRGSARYRQAMVERLLEKLHAEHSLPEAAQ